jgi:uncharacterized protein (TIGR03437 family)
VLTVWPAIAFSQVPVIFPNGVVNAASYEPTNITEDLAKYVPPGSIISILGQNLAPSKQIATTIPLPLQLAGTSVMVGSVAAPLFYVSPGQINFQMPDWGTGTPPLVVSAAGGASDPYAFVSSSFVTSLFGIFTADASGCGRGAVLNVGSDGAVSVNSASNSVSPGDYISVYGTGPGVLPPAYGTPTPIGPLFTTSDYTESAFDFGTHGNVLWAGLAPGLIGVQQINLQIPSAAREGCAVPLQVTDGFGFISQPVTVSIRRGGGPCVDPPSAGYGQITWEKTLTTSATGAASEADVMTMSLQASPGKQAPPLVTFSENFNTSRHVLFGRSCPLPGYRSLGAGTVSAQGPGFGLVQASVLPLQEGPISGLTEYQVTLLSGSIQPGSFTIAASGGADVGAFQTNVQVGSGIQVTTPLAGGTLSCFTPVIKWTGGDPNTWVTLKLLRLEGGLELEYLQQVRASDGGITIETTGNIVSGINAGNGLGFECLLPISGNGPFEVVLEVTPDPSQTPSFSAPGLSLGGQHLWKYTYRFEDVTLTQGIEPL